MVMGSDPLWAYFSMMSGIGSNYDLFFDGTSIIKSKSRVSLCSLIPNERVPKDWPLRRQSDCE
jgi:hypothetical protein